MSQDMPRVVIGMDPHKRTATIEVMTADEIIVGGGQFTTDTDGYTAMRDYGRQWPERVWAVEGCEGIGRQRSSDQGSRGPIGCKGGRCRGVPAGAVESPAKRWYRG